MSEFKEIVSKNNSNLTYKFNQQIDSIKTQLSKEFTMDAYENKMVNLYDKNKKLMSCTYEIIGIYDTKTNIFTWGCNTLNDKNLLKISSKIRKYVKSLENMIIKKEYSDTNYMERLHYYLSNCMFYIQNDNIKDLMEFCIYVSKCKGILEDGSDVKTFYVITDTM